MPPDCSEKRYTEQEVALVLRRAAEIEARRQDSAVARGLTATELRQIAHEAGFGPDVVDQAIVDLQRRDGFQVPSLLGPSPSHKVVRAVPGRLDESQLHRLVQVVEDRTSATGVVSEALGAVRWTSVPEGHRSRRTTQVAFTPTGEETQIQVTERLAPHLRTVFHILPGIWGTMIGIAVVGSLGVTTALPIFAAIAAGGVAGIGIGGAVWRRLTRRNRQRADDLATALVEAVEPRSPDSQA